MTNDQNNEAAPQAGAEDGERIAKVLARAGLCSRREAEEWVLAGRVAVDGKVLKTPAVVVTGKNRVTVDGQPLPVKERTRLWLFHKPRGLVTTTHDPEGRPTVFSVLPEDMPRVVTVGRLDINTEGLLLLTNDGGVARVLELPATGWLRRYRVRAFGEVDQAALKELSNGVSLDGVDYGPIEAEIERVQGHNSWLVLGLREGKNREVKRVLASLGLTVNRLIRVSFGPFQLADLEEGEIREIRGRVLKDQLGKRLVAESGADFDAPIVHHIHGAEDEEAPKRRIRDFTPAEERGERPERKGRPERTKMDFIGTGERRRGEDGGDRPRFRSEGFRDRGAGSSGNGGRFRSEGFRDRGGPGGGGFGGKSGGYRDRPDGDRPEGGRMRSEGFRDRGAGRSEGFRDRPNDGAPGRDRAEGPRGNRGDWDFKVRPKGPMRPDGDAPRGRGRDFGDGEGRGRPRSEGFRGGPGGEGGRSEGFRGRPDGGFSGRGGPRGEDRGAPRGDFADRRPRGEEGGERPRGGGFKPRPDATGFGPKGPRGMSVGDRRPAPPRDAGDGEAGGRPNREGGRPPREGGRPGPKGFGGKSFGPKGGGEGRGGPKGFGGKGDGPRGGAGGKPRGPGGFKGGGKGGPKGGPRGGGPKGGRS